MPLPLERVPLDLRRERVIEAYDGPLLVLHRNNANERFLELWLERDKARNRWFLFRTTELALAEFEFLKRTLRDLLLEAPDGYGFVREKENGNLVQVAMLAIAELPNRYLPTDDSYHDQELNPRFARPENDQVFLLDGDWEIDRFRELDRKYKQVYAFMGAFGTRRIGNEENLMLSLRHRSFGSRWSYKTAFDRLMHSLPIDNRAKMIAVQYASPGLVRFRAEATVAQSIREAFQPFFDSPHEVNRRYSVAHRLVVDLGNRTAEAHGEPTHDHTFKELEGELKRRLRELATTLAVVDFQALISLTGSVLIAGELLVTFVRRMRSLIDFAESGGAELAGMHRTRDMGDDEVEIDDELMAQGRSSGPLSKLRVLAARHQQSARLEPSRVMRKRAEDEDI